MLAFYCLEQSMCELYCEINLFTCVQGANGRSAASLPVFKCYRKGIGEENSFYLLS